MSDMKIETEDYTTWIVDDGFINGEPYKEYENIDGKKWIIYGSCNACGCCEEEKKYNYNIRIDPKTGKNDMYVRELEWTNKPGIPGACIEKNYELRKDIPMTPDFVNKSVECSLKGKWIENGN
jgi:hypothetical protein